MRIRDHWLGYRPTMAKQLQDEGVFEHLVNATAERVLETQAELMQRGMSPDQAREATRELWALPDEDDVPDRLAQVLRRCAERLRNSSRSATSR